jgi:hypothetical protein
MTATFIEVEAAELAKIEADPSLAEGLFQSGHAMPMVFGELAKTMQDRVRAAGPQMFAAALSNLDPRIKKQLEERLGHSTEAFAAGGGGDALLKMMEERRARAVGISQMSKKAHPTISLEKEWHGVHFVLCGEIEPGQSLLSKAVLGGKALGEDDEGFSGYGPARCFTPQQVAELSSALSQAELETKAAARFDAERMNKLKIYPGWRSTDAEPVMAAFRSLRDFYADAAGRGHAIVTCLI